MDWHDLWPLLTNPPDGQNEIEPVDCEGGAQLIVGSFRKLDFEIGNERVLGVVIDLPDPGRIRADGTRPPLESGFGDCAPAR
jgi:hypothetical protein